MAHNLEAPPGAEEDTPDWASLYRARGDEVVRYRPVFTGDVFEEIPISDTGTAEQARVLILHHPCSLRTNGVDLVDKILVAEVRQHSAIPAREWKGHLRKMPLPGLYPDQNDQNYAAFFNDLHFAKSGELEPTKRVSCFSQLGVNLLLQRWVSHTSRVIIPTFKYQEVTEAQYEEADICEDWCEIAIESATAQDGAVRDFMALMRESAESRPTRQARLENPQERGAIRKEMRKLARERYAS